uniref:Ubiquitin-conjugating enzyme E2 Z n=1 Tax=Paramoeba aestuarina TaxID=180227 RepID=A0A7S4JY37_9EUKA|mmetsp:Transcript_13996/g.21768  ORF Transcript_13996/g.21768 Transcript_13996/m.21768 type:complete len:337 (+) Transcript_13996:46-1056(+)|eukprot:CAMPEP_0201517544 /NCGR_PEP_ID=MMETSP0161_2-20130828/8621_1 /ASSEMBLY_ACC=CAM_ASM_000251 /TAXON_ID=180227 /ORGANISM="Neoparamoeba aestuarina, Strain SoJaBio B1-5/56/2" /LENGTH=336 /DNA_ID=CAMNT_0047915075 /DNA_START=72 /DNA_END=1082 /DNA_ORIENTATION=+
MADIDLDLELAKKLAEEDGKMSDEEYAKMLSEQLNSAPVSSEFSADAELARQLQKEEEEKEKKQKEQLEKQKALQAAQQKANQAKAAQVAAQKQAAPFQTPQAPLGKKARKRVFQDLKAVIVTADPTIHVHFEDDISRVECLIVGPSETPYEGGFFHFTMTFPQDYPWSSPKVLLRTTDAGLVRFNPNLYANGKVCLSILGTWSGPAWSPVQTVSSVLLSIQSLMNKFPYHNEPGFEKPGKGRERENYNDVIRHETIRVAVLGMMDAPTWGDCETFNQVRNKTFLNNIETYERIIKENIHLDGKAFNDPFGGNQGTFKYAKLLERLSDLKVKHQAP